MIGRCIRALLYQSLECVVRGNPRSNVIKRPDYVLRLRDATLSRHSLLKYRFFCLVVSITQRNRPWLRCLLPANGHIPPVQEFPVLLKTFALKRAKKENDTHGLRVHSGMQKVTKQTTPCNRFIFLLVPPSILAKDNMPQNSTQDEDPRPIPVALLCCPWRS